MAIRGVGARNASQANRMAKIGALLTSTAALPGPASFVASAIPSEGQRYGEQTAHGGQAEHSPLTRKPPAHQRHHRQQHQRRGHRPKRREDNRRDVLSSDRGGAEPRTPEEHVTASSAAGPGPIAPVMSTDLQRGSRFAPAPSPPARPTASGWPRACTAGGSEVPTAIHSAVGIIAGTTTRAIRQRARLCAMPRAA